MVCQALVPATFRAFEVVKNAWKHLQENGESGGGKTPQRTLITRQQHVWVRRTELVTAEQIASIFCRFKSIRTLDFPLTANAEQKQVFSRVDMDKVLLAISKIGADELVSINLEQALLTAPNQRISPSEYVRFFSSSHFMNLRKLEFGGDSVTDDVLVQVGAGCPNLADFTLAFPDRSTSDAGVRAVFHACAQLTSVTLLQNPHHSHLTDAALSPLAVGRCPLLANLELNDIGGTVWTENSPWSDLGLALVLHGCLALSPSSIVSRNIGDRFLSVIAIRFQQIEELDFAYAQTITDIGLVTIARECRNLNRIHFEECTSFTSLGISAFAHEDSKLVRFHATTEDLDVNLESLWDAGAAALLTRCPFLTPNSIGIDGVGALYAEAVALMDIPGCIFVNDHHADTSSGE
jgi:hypothetical protein